jgi:hypothetical protein
MVPRFPLFAKAAVAYVVTESLPDAQLSSNWD